MKESSFVEAVKNKSYLNNVPDIDTTRRKMYMLFSGCHRRGPGCKMIMRNDFHPVFKMAAFIGISFPCTEENKEDERKDHHFRKYYDITVTAITFVALAIAIIFAHNFTASKAMTLTYGVKYVAAFCIRCYMVIDNYKIPNVITTISQLYEDISLSIYKSLKVKIYLQSIAFTVLNIFMLVLTSLRLLYEDEVHNLPYIDGFGYNFTANGTVNVVHMLIASYFLNYSFTVFTVAVSILSCCNVHLILRRLIKSYGDSLVENIKSDSSKENFAKEFSTFRRIIYAMNEADDAMSFIVFFTYVTCISCFFNTLSGFLASNGVFEKPCLAAEMALTFIFSVIIFSTMTCSAAEVSTAGERLKQRVLCISDIVLQRNLPSDALMEFMILTDGIKTANISMTGWGMFTITRGFVLSTVGVLITYGVLLFQFG
ncbi:hypothetical protein AVEN_65588-1 [Araneus ventricosus]|uniref:Gustatory receptor n=1 Tax=Araneus ventricosus TaxID=182803 RepID=A0A4Y2PMB1_ARAVE|nr:hypothetical protein AVEN_65588-1 [Araneus ventricosus]